MCRHIKTPDFKSLILGRATLSLFHPIARGTYVAIFPLESLGFRAKRTKAILAPAWFISLLRQCRQRTEKGDDKGISPGFPKQMETENANELGSVWRRWCVVVQKKIMCRVYNTFLNKDGTWMSFCKQAKSIQLHLNFFGVRYRNIKESVV